MGADWLGRDSITPRTQTKYQYEYQGHRQAVRAKSQFFVVVLILMFSFQNANNKITTTTENLPTQSGYVLGIHADILSEFMVFIESLPIYYPDEASVLWPPIMGGHRDSSVRCKPISTFKTYSGLLMHIPRYAFTEISYVWMALKVKVGNLLASD